MIHYGDITKIRGYDVPVVDCVVGGSPCQNFSVAGNQQGLEGDQSVLFVEQLRVIKEMRERDARSGRTGEFIRPRFMVWENVPGAFSTNKGQDFRKVLEETAKVVDKDAVIPMPPKNKWTTSGCIVGDGWSIAWRVLDAQFWGVPQRRRRIALVADFGGGCAQEILFVRKSLRRDSEESRTERQSAASNAQGCIEVQDRNGECMSFHLLQDTITSNNISPCITSGNSKSGQACVGVCIGKSAMVVEGIDVYNQCATGNKAKTLTRGAADSDHIPCVVMDKDPGAVCYCVDSSHLTTNNDMTQTLRARDYKEPLAVCYVVDQGGGKSGANVSENLAPTLICTHGGEPVICLQGNGIDRADTAGCSGKGWKEGTCYTLNTVDRPAVAYEGSRDGMATFKINGLRYIVRRLTPLECERLQGFPDRWTDIGEYIDSKGKKKKSSDSARYKDLGNSIALPPWKWVIKRLCSHYERDVTLASLFDGIGGFPVLWEQINGKGSCLWASEIEDFPIAVTKARIE